MGFFDRFRNQAQYEVDDLLLEALRSGKSISRDNAMSIPAVSSAVNMIADAFAMIPIRLYEEKEVDGRKTVEEVKDSRVSLINKDTKDTLDGVQFKKALATDYLMGKGGYAYINKRGNKVISLHYVKDNAVIIEKNKDQIFKQIALNVSGKSYQPYEFIKLLRNTKDGASGRGLADEVGSAIKSAYETMLYQLNLITTGGNKRGFIQSKHKLTAEAMAALKKAWKNMYSNNSENAVVLNDGLEFKEAQNNAVEMQLNESVKTFDEQIKAIFHICDNFADTFKFAILPICEAFVTALNRDLLLEKEKENRYFVADYSEMLKASQLERYNAYKVAKEAGFLTLNEIRIKENMQTLEGLDVIAMSLGTVLYDTESGQYYVPNTGENISLEEGGKGYETGEESGTE